MCDSLKDQNKRVYSLFRSHRASNFVPPLFFDGTSLPLWCVWPGSHPCVCLGYVARWPPSRRRRRPLPLRPRSTVWRCGRTLMKSAGRKLKFGFYETPPTHLFSLRPAADLQTLIFTDGHLETERNPDVAQIFHPRIEGEALHAAYLLAAEVRWRRNAHFHFWLYWCYNTITIYEDHPYCWQYKCFLLQAPLGGHGWRVFRFCRFHLLLLHGLIEGVLWRQAT